MTFYRYLPALPFLLLGNNIAIAADNNGYVAQYECRAGSSACNVDIAALARRACDQIITSSTAPTNSWAAIDWNNDTICVGPGDHRSRGPLYLTVSGSNTSRKIIRSTDATPPWRLSAADRARLSRVEFNGADNWVVHGLAIDDTINFPGVYFTPDSGATYNILDHVLIQGHDNSLVHFMWGNRGNRLQNSVVRSSRPSSNENNCVAIGGSPDTWITNNEIYDCNKAISAGSGVWSIPGTKIENNDLYVSPNVYTDCRGNYTPNNPQSQCAANEAVISLKAGGTSTDLVHITHNRMWGARSGDSAVLGGVNGGEAPTISVSNDMPNNPGYPGADYLLIANNVIWDTQVGIGNWWGTPDHFSVIGNIFFDIKRQQGDYPGYAIRLNQVSNAEIYFNTFVETENWIQLLADVRDTDIRCNVVIDSPAKTGSTSGSTVADNNAFFNGAVLGQNYLSFSSAGQSATGDYCFFRKLRTGPEQVCIPKVKPTSSSPHVRACNTAVGTRANVGISDAALF